MGFLKDVLSGVERNVSAGLNHVDVTVNPSISAAISCGMEKTREWITAVDRVCCVRKRFSTLFDPGES